MSKLDHVVTQDLSETIICLFHHPDIFDSLHYDTATNQLRVCHALGEDLIREGMYLTAKYGNLVTSI
ncbi:hypothetical protein [Acinetobacter sp. V89_7]|uniref:hypothetical protein n=1 Tax=Acinetobacter sp. V89_7 TaxID=3044233 RepID=UPI00249F85D5|nr:hypothetical protein [Acinetobacter sp. V89_7]MDI3378904.1 hypothetical protein [Acinetobacter sp. V89_7]